MRERGECEDRCEGNVDRERREEGEALGGTCHNDKPGQNGRDGEGMER